MFFRGVFVVDLILMTRHHYHYHHELLSLQNSVQQMFNSFFTPLNSTQLGSNVVFEFEVHLQNAVNEETIVKPKNDSRAQMKQCTYRWSSFTTVFEPPDNNCVRGRKVLQEVFC